MSVRRLAETQPEGFAFSQDNASWAAHTIAKFPEGRQASAVIPLLWRAQEQEGWVSKPAIETIAAMLDMPTIRVLEVATFYTMFHLEPVGTAAHVQVCGTTPCMLRGSGDLIDLCRSRIHEHPHHTSADGRFSWEEVECLGACVNAPMVQIFSDTYEDLTAESLGALLDAFGRGEKPKPGPQIDRQYGAPATGLTSLTDIESDDSALGNAATAPAHAGQDRSEPAAAGQVASEDTAGGEYLVAERMRREGQTPDQGGGADPASGVRQEKGRPDPSGRADEAAARAEKAEANGNPQPDAEPAPDSAAADSERDNSGPRSDRDSARGDREGD
jgi:NADH-quinone oxidoreductase subunit E